MESYEILWKTALPELEKTMSSISYDTYITQIKPVDIVGGKLIFLTGNKLFAETVTTKHSAKIVEALKKCSSEIHGIEVVVGDSYDRESLEGTDAEQAAAGLPVKAEFTFESFVVGPSNEMIYAAAKAVAEHPGDAYNPLFIYGGTGLGKTHILMAIANYLRLHKPSKNVLYATCEQFTNQLIDSIGRGRGLPARFREKYRNVDVLLIDDVQFLANKQGSQNEFFHTFNELVMQNKQVVLTSDRPPREIEVLEERLRTRFEGGLLADVQTPDLETRIAILRRKSEEQKCLIDIKVLTYIAEMSDADIRTLIGKLTKVIFASKLHECPITVDLVKEALKESAGEREEELQMDDIIDCVCGFYKVSKNDIFGKKKNKEFTEPRQVCAYLIANMMNVPLASIGAKLGGRDHATIIYARDKVAELIKTDNKLRVEINDIKKMITKE